MPHVSSRPSALGILLMSLTCPPLLCFTLLLRAAREELKERSSTADVGKVLTEEVIKGPICPAWQGHAMAMKPGVPSHPASLGRE